MEEDTRRLPGLRARGAATGEIAGQLVCLAGSAVGRVFPLERRPTVIGRGAETDVQVLGADVSRRHAQLTWEGEACFLEDLDSRNGIAINGHPVLRQRLAVGDRIEIGTSAVFVFNRPDELEQRALRLQKLEAMSQLAAALTHDFKNMLAVISTNAEVLGELAVARYPHDPDLRDSLEDIRGAAATATMLIRRVLDFARRRDGVAAPAVAVPVRRVVDDTLALVSRGSSSRVKVSVQVDPTLVVLGNPVELQQVLTNLCINAQQAMPTGGALTIVAHRLSLGRGEALAMQLDDAGEYVDLRVSDTGIGMDAETVARVFEPFFTTRPSEGTGLGLSSVYGLVRSRGGNVLVESRPGHGTTFRVLLQVPPSPEKLDRETEAGARLDHKLFG